jgi:hypothetical protein
LRSEVTDNLRILLFCRVKAAQVSGKTLDGTNMLAASSSEIASMIDDAIRDFTWLSEQYRHWFASHRVEPKPISIAETSEGTARAEFWLLTDHTGVDDSSFRIIYDEARKRFGRECVLENDIPLFLGVYPTLQDALDEII